jgi:hypothetical protein
MHVSGDEVISALKTSVLCACSSCAHSREGMREVVLKARERLVSKIIR